MPEEQEKTDKMTSEKANEIRVLIKEDIRKYELEITKHEIAISQLRSYISECNVTLADVDRREAGVMYPPPPAAKKGGEGGEGQGK